MDLSGILGAISVYFDEAGKNDKMMSAAKTEAELFAWKKQVEIDTQKVMLGMAEESNNREMATKLKDRLTELDAMGDMYGRKALYESGLNGAAESLDDPAQFYRTRAEADAALRGGKTESFSNDLYENLRGEAEMKRAELERAKQSGKASKADIFNLQQAAAQADIMATNYLKTYGQRYMPQSGQQAQAAPAVPISQQMAQGGFVPKPPPAQSQPAQAPQSAQPSAPPQQQGPSALGQAAGMPTYTTGEAVDKFIVKPLTQFAQPRPQGVIGGR